MAGIDPNAAVHTHMHDAAGVDLEAKHRFVSFVDLDHGAGLVGTDQPHVESAGSRNSRNRPALVARQTNHTRLGRSYAPHQQQDEHESDFFHRTDRFRAGTLRLYI